MRQALFQNGDGGLALLRADVPARCHIPFEARFQPRQLQVSAEVSRPGLNGLPEVRFCFLVSLVCQFTFSGGQPDREHICHRSSFSQLNRAIQVSIRVL